MTDLAQFATTPTRGHPPGLYVLFFAEMWERFCYYGMRALLAFYVASTFATGEGGASLTYGAYTALVYATGIVGGWAADRMLGAQRSVILGGVMMAIGEFVLMVPTEFCFLGGLTLMVVGCGLFKPNISNIVGKLYAPGDNRRDQGFVIFYMGINLGAFIAPLICGYVGETYGWRWGFLCAGLGMLLGIGTFMKGAHKLQGEGAPPAGKEGFGPVAQVLGIWVLMAFGIYVLLSKQEWMLTVMVGLLAAVVLLLLGIAVTREKIERDRMIGLTVLLLANTFFWALFEQAGSSLNFFAKNCTDRTFLGWEMPATWFQSVNAVCIIAFAPLFVQLWRKLDASNRNPSIPIKFGIGILPLGLGFGVLILGVSMAAEGATQISMFWLILLYMLHTAGELCISPVGLSAMTKLAPPSMSGLVMGAWFMSIAAGNYSAGLLAQAVGSAGGEDGVAQLHDYVGVYSPAMLASFGVGVLVLILAPVINRMLHGVR
ncbi:MAG: peptide MFS transporter [Planctomycetota bacterium]